MKLQDKVVAAALAGVIVALGLSLIEDPPDGFTTEYLRGESAAITGAAAPRSGSPVLKRALESWRTTGVARHIPTPIEGIDDARLESQRIAGREPCGARVERFVYWSSSTPAEHP
jgi:hypothetical protein